ncbi:hypothetical protein TWF694_009369 [Orbilia ellipsospora]|uniref:Uncharacterized protein n=1 Tax=Orbilia ellipsospora TaxID=2528407 RepID=A0AAV9XEQ1_9PEZI
MSAKFMTRASHSLHQGPLAIGRIFMLIVTIPYYNIFWYNNLNSVSRILAAESDSIKLIDAANGWMDKKSSELKFVQVASAIIAAAVIASFSWPNIGTDYWLCPALWYSSLVLAGFALLVSSQQVAIIESFGKISIDSSEQDLLRVINSIVRLKRVGSGYELSWNSVYIWQSSMMSLSYSWCAYMAGLTLHVCSPLIMGKRSGPEFRTAIMFIVVAGFTCINFSWCSYWVYAKSTKRDD